MLAFFLLTLSGLTLAATAWGTIQTGLADIVIGQPNFTSGFPGWFSGPTGAAVDGSGVLWVADFGGNRVLGFQPPLSSGMDPSLVLGQGNLASTTFYGTFQDTMYHPDGVIVDGSGNLWVADFSDNRVLEFKPPFSQLMKASLVLGQPIFTSGVYSYGASTSGMHSPVAVAVDGAGDVWVADEGNNRVLEFKPPLSIGMNANLVLG